MLPGYSEERRNFNLRGIWSSCGVCFQHIEDHGEGNNFNLVHANDKLMTITCQMPIEASYYATFNDLLCCYCGSGRNVTETDGHYPLCGECEGQGNVSKKRITRAFAPRQAARE